MRSSSSRLESSFLFHRTFQLISRGFGGTYGTCPTVRLPTTRSLVRVQPQVDLDVLHWDGPARTPIVLLHGLNNNAWSWARVATILSAERPVYAVSLRGHGRSSAPPSGYLLDDTTADLEGLLSALQLERVCIAGHSWGGKVACHFTATHGDLVRSLILADPVPPQGLNVWIRALPALMSAALRAERGPFSSKQQLEAAGRSLIYLMRWDELDQQLWQDSFDEDSDGGFAHRLPEDGFQQILREAIGASIVPMLARIQAPALLLRPTFTLSFWPGELKALRAVIALDESTIRGDHTFIHTNPFPTAEAMGAFLRRKPGALHM